MSFTVRSGKKGSATQSKGDREKLQILENKDLSNTHPETNPPRQFQNTGTIPKLPRPSIDLSVPPPLHPAPNTHLYQSQIDTVGSSVVDMSVMKDMIVEINHTYRQTLELGINNNYRKVLKLDFKS